jgi:hypothetical protein
MMHRTAIGISLALACCGCASVSTKITGTSRSGSEELLLTGTADRVICLLNFHPLIGAKVFLDASNLDEEDKGWMTFALRRAMARQGVLTVDDKKDAQVVMEAAVGAYGTDEVDFRLTTPSGIPLMPLGTATTSTLTGGNALIRKNRQDAVVKLALAAYDTTSHRLVWESGTILNKQALDRHFFGTTELSRHATLPENQDYPRRRGF